jgi:hypothetical protein
MFWIPGLIFDGTEGVGSRFHVLRAPTRFRRYRGRQVSFSCFERPESFSAVPRASRPILMFCAPEHVFDSTEGVAFRFFLFCTLGIVFGGSEGVGSRFHVLNSRTRFQRC